ncbi:MAG: DNA repair protein RadC [Patescibacteria group bacterium]
MKIKKLDKYKRPRERLSRYGLGRLTNEEILAILLGSGIKGTNVLLLSKKILRLLYSKKQIIQLSDLISIKGVGQIKAQQIIAALEFGRRISALYGKKVLALSPKDIWNDVKDIRQSKKEHFVVFYLDVKNEVIKKDVVSIGTLNASLVHPREVFEPAVRYNAAQIIVAHNHPSNDVHPSEQDLLVTKNLIAAGKILGIEVIDHVIICESSFYSFKEQKLL